MNPTEQKQFEGSPRRRGSSVSKEDKEVLLACWVLRKAGFSDRSISRLKFPKSHHTIDSYFFDADEMISEGKLEMPFEKIRDKRPILCSEGELERINSKISANPCGGGKRKAPVNYDSGLNQWDE